MISKPLAALFLSIAIHSLLLYMLTRAPVDPVPEKPEKLSVAWIDRPAPKKAANPRGTPVPLARLRPSFGTGGNFGTISGGTGISFGPGTDLDSAPWGSGSGDFGQIEHYNKHRQLLEQAQGLLYFPPALGRRNISGTVNARLVFGEDHGCDSRKTRILGANPYLKYYSLAVLKKLCKLDNVKHIGFTKNQIVDFSFSFVITEGTRTYKQDEKSDRIVGNLLAFERSYPKSILEYNIGPLKGIWLVPAVSLDFAWISEKWEKHVEGLDPLREFKDPR